MTHEELVALVAQQQAEIDRLSALTDRLYHASPLPAKDREQKLLEQVEAHTEELNNELAELEVQANAGDPRAQFSLGYTHYYAKGVAENSVEGVRWWTLAAQQGFAEAQWELGNAYVAGRGVNSDVITGYAWMHLSAQNGFVFAPRDKDKIAKTMFAGQIIRAEELAATLQTNLPAANPATTPQPL